MKLFIMQSSSAPFSTFSVLGQNIPLSTLFSNTLNVCLPILLETKFHTHTKEQVQ